MDKHAAVGAAVNRLPYPAIRNRALVILRERSEEEDDDSARRGSRSVDAAPSSSPRDWKPWPETSRGIAPYGYPIEAPVIV